MSRNYLANRRPLTILTALSAAALFAMPACMLDMDTDVDMEGDQEDALVAQANGVVLTETYDGGLGKWVEHGGCYGYSFQTQKDPTNNNNKVLRVRNVVGDDNRNCPQPPWNSPKTDAQGRYFKHRAELIPKAKNTRAQPGEEIWWGQRIFIPGNFPESGDPGFKDGVTFVATQIIPAPFNGTDFDLRINSRSEWEVGVRRTPAGKPRNDLKKNLGPIKRGKWVSWVIRYRRSTSDDGVAEVWQDGKRVLFHRGVTSQSNEKDGLMKHGLYRGSRLNLDKNGGKDYRVFFDDVRVAKGRNRFNAVNPDA